MASTRTPQNDINNIISGLQLGIIAAMPQLKKAAEAIAEFDKTFKKEQKIIQEKLHSGSRKSKSDPV